jgi:hypothetical protein
MKRLIAVVALTIGVFALSAAPAGAAKGGTDRPFKASASLSGFVDLNPSSPGFLSFDAQGPGFASHLGNTFGGVTASLLSPASTATSTAANGDQLYSAFVAELPATNTCPPGFFPFHNRSEFTGGTGRFTNATGTFEGEGCFQFDPGTGAVVITVTNTGTISY